jgi:hypothetical protein
VKDNLKGQLATCKELLMKRKEEGNLRKKCEVLYKSQVSA